MILGGGEVWMRVGNVTGGFVWMSVVVSVEMRLLSLDVVWRSTH